MVKITLLPGDGIGPEVVAQAVKVLQVIDQYYNLDLKFQEAPIGGIAAREWGHPLPPHSLAHCQDSAAILLGAVGGPQFDDLPQELRPEAGLLALRSKLGLFANLRPVTIFPGLEHASPLKTASLAGVDILIVRELTGDIYFGQPRYREDLEGGEQRATDTMTYTTTEIRRVAQLAFRMAQGRTGKVTSVDKANVLECSRLWREVVTEVSREFPDVTLEHQLVDSCAMGMITNPQNYDVLLTGNLFGDILSDEGAVLAGSLGLLPSASIGGTTLGLYEPIHGSAPSIARQNRANPLGTILSTALLLRHSLQHDAGGRAVEQAVEGVLGKGFATEDLQIPNCKRVGTEEMGNLVCQELLTHLERGK